MAVISLSPSLLGFYMTGKG